MKKIKICSYFVSLILILLGMTPPVKAATPFDASIMRGRELSIAMAMDYSQENKINKNRFGTARLKLRTPKTHRSSTSQVEVVGEFDMIRPTLPSEFHSLIHAFFVTQPKLEFNPLNVTFPVESYIMDRSSFEKALILLSQSSVVFIDAKLSGMMNSIEVKIEVSLPRSSVDIYEAQHPELDKAIDLALRKRPNL